MSQTPQDILDFWEELGPKKWWKKDVEVDREICERFGAAHKAAASGNHDDWMDSADGALALIIVLDQFSRNIFRDDRRAFAEDTRCAHLARRAIEDGLDGDMREGLRPFCYLPLMHAENIHDQRLCLEKMEETGRDDNVKAAREHLEIIEKFGRFPHRNTVLGRETTAAEQKFLDDGGFSG